ncbi:MAG: hypothetical protein M1822_004403 [Bathelium mastoideum]|nr:MAG: hypothetical protein M1822_004403 [Bathelium mastoideum]
MASNPPKDIQIDATDVNEGLVKACNTMVERNGWPFKAQSFNDDEGAAAAARHIYRTLKPGGIAIATVWITSPRADALRHAHYLTRGRSGPMLGWVPKENYDRSLLQANLTDGGFKKENISFFDKDAFLRISDLARYSQLLWSYLGRTSDGWSEADEDNWEKAVSEIEKELSRGYDIAKNEKGETMVRITTCVGIARKE